MTQRPGCSRRAVLGCLVLFSLTILIGVTTIPFAWRVYYIQSESMVPTLHPGDMVIANNWSYLWRKPTRFDIVVFRAPDWALRPGQAPEKTLFVQRIIGVPGDVIEIKAGKGVYLNGKLLQEPYTNGAPEYSMKIVDGLVYEYDDMGGMWKGGPHMMRVEVLDPEERRRVFETPTQPIPPGKYLVLGDNRNNSSDSHFWGLLDESRIIGKVLFRR
jgi:signal peptidase I